MKSQKGITLTSLVLYIMLVLIVLGILSVITASFQNNLKEVNKEGTKNSEVDSFNMYFLQEVKKQGNKISTISENKDEIIFGIGDNKSTLPSEYQQVEYIESTGTQIILSGLIPSNDLKFEAKFEFTELPVSTDNNRYLFSYFENGHTYRPLKVQNNQFYSIYMTKGAIDGINLAAADTNIHTIVYNSDAVFDGINKGSIYREISPTNNIGIGFFGQSQITNESNNKFVLNSLVSARIYYVKGYSKSTRTEVGHYIPCYRKSDNVIGMYDTVNNQFYTNVGTGTFLKGADINKSWGNKYTFKDEAIYLNDNIKIAENIEKCNFSSDLVNGKTIITVTIKAKDAEERSIEYVLSNEELSLFYENQSDYTTVDYTEIEYIKSTRTQFIDTGYVPGMNPKVVMELKFDGTFDVTGSCNIIGVIEKENGVSFSMNFGGASNQGNEIFTWYRLRENNEIYSIKINDNIRTNKNILSFGQGATNYGGVTNTLPERTKANTKSLVIMGRVIDGEYKAFNAYNMYLYSCKIYEGENLERDYIPVLDKDGTACLYDKVESKYYYNQGTGDFIAGPEI